MCHGVEAVFSKYDLCITNDKFRPKLELPEAQKLEASFSIILKSERQYQCQSVTDITKAGTRSHLTFDYTEMVLNEELNSRATERLRWCRKAADPCIHASCTGFGRPSIHWRK